MKRKNRKLDKSFYKQDAVTVAKQLLGCYLVHKTKEGTVVGRIIETEGYLSNDPASHSFRGKTPRNAPMFEKGGIAYVYFTYGMHHCFNVVTGDEGVGEAVLIRAVEPVLGQDIMIKRRGRENNIADGPAKLTIAFSLGKDLNKHSLVSDELYILERDFDVLESKIMSTPRIGISQGKELLYRFVLKR